MIVRHQNIFAKIWSLTKVIVISLSSLIIFFYIDIWIILLTELSEIFEEKYSIRKYQLGPLDLSGVLSQN